jgi:hypothetical protein
MTISADRSDCEFQEPHELSFVQRNRRALLLDWIDLNGRGLEIGAYSQPTVLKSEGNISYLDVQSREALIAGLPDKSEACRIPPVDCICTSGDYASVVSGQVDYIIANHVFEHVANPIAWLQMVSRMLVVDGVLFLSVPDKKYTFDKYRPDTPLSHILHDYFSGVQTTSMEHVIESEMYYDQEFIGRAMRVEERLNLARLRAAFDIPMHPGWHCHVFQCETFREKILKPLQFMGLIDYELVAFCGAQASTGGEFSLVLRKRKVCVELGTAEFFTLDYDLPLAEPLAPVSLPNLVSRIAGKARGLFSELRQRFWSR